MSRSAPHVSLSVPREALVAAARQVAIQIRALGPAARWFDTIGFPIGPHAATLDAEAAALEDAAWSTAHKDGRERGLRAVRRDAVAEAHTALRTLRARVALHVLQQRPGAPEVQAALRALGRVDTHAKAVRHHLDGAVTALCAAGWTAELDELRPHQAAFDTHDAEVAAAAALADANRRAAVEAYERLRDHVRAVRAAWRVAQARSGGDVPRLALRVLESRTRVTRRKRTPASEAAPAPAVDPSGAATEG